jgi:hypothetical protein
MIMHLFLALCLMPPNDIFKSTNCEIIITQFVEPAPLSCLFCHYVRLPVPMFPIHTFLSNAYYEAHKRHMRDLFFRQSNIKFAVYFPISCTLALISEDRSNYVIHKEMYWLFIRLERHTAFDISPCSPLKFNWRSEGAYRVHPESQRLSQERKQREITWQTEFVLILPSLSTMVSCMARIWRWRWNILLEISVGFQRTTRSHIPEDITLHNNRCENLRSYTDLFWKLCDSILNKVCPLLFIKQKNSCEYPWAVWRTIAVYNFLLTQLLMKLWRLNLTWCIRDLEMCVQMKLDAWTM